MALQLLRYACLLSILESTIVICAFLYLFFVYLCYYMHHVCTAVQESLFVQSATKERMPYTYLIIIPYCYYRDILSLSCLPGGWICHRDGCKEVSICDVLC